MMYFASLVSSPWTSCLDVSCPPVIDRDWFLSTSDSDVGFSAAFGLACAEQSYNSERKLQIFSAQD